MPPAKRAPKPAHRTVVTYHQVHSSPDEPLVIELDAVHTVQMLDAREIGPDIRYTYVVVSDA